MTTAKRETKKKTVYLCGPIDGPIEVGKKDDLHGWRDRIKSSMMLNRIHTEEVSKQLVHVLTPNYHYLDPTDRIYTHADIQDPNIIKEIVQLDKWDISSSDIVLGNFTMMDKYKYVGSTMELIYAYGLGKYVMVIMKPSDHISPWIRYHATQIVFSEQEAVEALRKLS